MGLRSAPGRGSLLSARSKRRLVRYKVDPKSGADLTARRNPSKITVQSYWSRLAVSADAHHFLKIDLFKPRTMPGVFEEKAKLDRTGEPKAPAGPAKKGPDGVSW